MPRTMLAVIVAVSSFALPFVCRGGEVDDLIFADRFEISSTGGPLTCPEDDAFEPNDEFETAAPIVPGTVIEAIVCSGNQDHYVVIADDGDELAILSSFSHAEGDLDMQLFREGQTDPLASSQGTSDSEFIAYTIPPGEGGNYIVRVFGFGAASNTYSLQVDITDSASFSPSGP